MDYLPSVVWTEVFCWLGCWPLKELLQLCRVCKEWNRLLQTHRPLWEDNFFKYFGANNVLDSIFSEFIIEVRYTKQLKRKRALLDLTSSGSCQPLEIVLETDKRFLLGHNNRETTKIWMISELVAQNRWKFGFALAYHIRGVIFRPVSASYPTKNLLQQFKTTLTTSKSELTPLLSQRLPAISEERSECIWKRIHSHGSIGMGACSLVGCDLGYAIFARVERLGRMKGNKEEDKDSTRSSILNTPQGLRKKLKLMEFNRSPPAVDPMWEDERTFLQLILCKLVPAVVSSVRLHRKTVLGKSQA